jgi:hypothetical protein
VRDLLGQNDIEDALTRLDTLTMGETRMTTAETLNTTHGLETKAIKQGRSSEKIYLHILFPLAYFP